MIIDFISHEERLAVQNQQQQFENLLKKTAKVILYGIGILSFALSIHLLI